MPIILTGTTTPTTPTGPIIGYGLTYIELINVALAKFQADIITLAMAVNALGR